MQGHMLFEPDALVDAIKGILEEQQVARGGAGALDQQALADGGLIPQPHTSHADNLQQLQNEVEGRLKI